MPRAVEAQNSNHWTGPLGRSWEGLSSPVLIVLPALCRPRPPSEEWKSSARRHSPHLLGAAEGTTELPGPSGPSTFLDTQGEPFPSHGQKPPIPPSRPETAVFGAPAQRIACICALLTCCHLSRLLPVLLSPPGHWACSLQVALSACWALGLTAAF